MTTTWTAQGQVAVFVAVDHHSAECVGIHAARRATRFEALESIRQGVRRCFGAFGPNVAQGLAVRHDHGSQYMSEAFQKELAFFGIESSPAFMRAPEGNGCAERSIRTLKENLLWVQAFNTVEDLRREPLAVGRHRHLGTLMPSGGVHPINTPGIAKVCPRRQQEAESMLDEGTRDRLVQAEPRQLPGSTPVIRTIAMPADTSPAGDIFGGWLMA